MEHLGMPLWQLLGLAGVALIIIELLTPTLFCLNLALACFATAGVSLYTQDYTILTACWVIFSALFILLLRPLLLNKKNKPGERETSMGRYIGMPAKVLEEIGKDRGVISIFDERWEARSKNDEKFAKGETVIIEQNDNLIMYVRKEK